MHCVSTSNECIFGMFEFFGMLNGLMEYRIDYVNTYLINREWLHSAMLKHGIGHQAREKI